MATLTIRNVDEKIRKALRKRAAENDVSMEEEVRRILARSVTQPEEPSRQEKRKRRMEALRKISAKPTEPFDLKAVSDEIWNARTL
ncbi:plasmid stabilization protein [Nitratireductor sp. ZSWI3]|uniref:FitA-like ribbon-helix-helix domain-containing protein n=1 Tax=Nitratireductor sp. ZSWI3 TaxID=2966359 RepID=UPI002150632F|nr:plasmid stabilization protein [Nitratireductor sp. ZSWI3]MCR4266369.1 plasmid stabilization protein [Nitratireductor sp. ZSWI3]